MEKVAVYLTFKKNHDNSFKKNTFKKINYYCKKNNYDYEIYLDKVDSGLDLLHRENFNKLKIDLDNGIFKKVVVLGVSNITRETTYLIDFIEHLKINDCKLEFIDGEKFSTEYFDIITRLMDKKIQKCEELER